MHCVAHSAQADPFPRGTKFLTFDFALSISAIVSNQDFGPYVGVRIGEAKNPGPTAYGSHRTRKNREAGEDDDDPPPSLPAIFDGDFKQQIMVMIKAMVMDATKEAINSMFGTTALPSNFGQGSSGCGKAATPTSSQDETGPSTHEALPGKGKGQQDASFADPDHGYKACKGKRWNRQKNTNDAKDMHGKSEGKGNNDQLPEETATAAPPSKGKGKGKAKSKTGNSSDSEWIEIRWKVRPSDLCFDKAFFDEETLAMHLDLDDGPALAQADDEKTLVDLFSILKGGCDKNSLLVFTGPCGPGPALEDIQQRHPVKMKYLRGTLRGQTRLRRCWVIGFNPHNPDFELTLAPEAEVVNTTKPKQRYNAADTVVMRASAALRLLEADQWKKVRGAPAASLREWIARADPKLLLAVRDTWGWQALDESQVSGLIQVVARALLERGGELLGGIAWFFTPLDCAKPHLSMPVNLYQKPEEGELDLDFVFRAATQRQHRRKKRIGSFLRPRFFRVL